MKKRILSLLLCILLCFSMVCPSVFADDSVPEHEHQWVDCGISSFDGSIVGLPVSVTVQQCSVCKIYLHTCNILGNVIKYPAITGYTDMGNELVQFLLPYVYKLIGQNATATKFAAGGGSTDGSGVGRNPAGYAGEGTPSYNVDGNLQLTVYPQLGSYANYEEYLYDYPAEFTKNYSQSSWHISGLAVTGRYLSSSGSDTLVSCYNYQFTAPISGTYFLKDRQCYVRGFYTYDFQLSSLYFEKGSYSAHLSEKNTSTVGHGRFSPCVGARYPTTSFSYVPIIVTVIPDMPVINQQTNITINNNTWNGNIYVDSSNKLTYIYPQYTTINENNETVTNISENPIIYNSETQQYYTYNSVTNNYYYITYEQPATPTPSPSPSPSPAPTETPTPSESPAPTPTPDPGENPTPTPTPGGGTTVTPGGDNPGSTSTPESGNKGDSGSSGWNPFKWLADLLKDIVEKILKAIWKLITSIFSFLLWLLSLVGKLFPFIPTQAITAITAGAVIVTVIRIIKFITGR